MTIRRRDGGAGRSMTQRFLRLRPAAIALSPSGQTCIFSLFFAFIVRFFPLCSEIQLSSAPVSQGSFCNRKESVFRSSIL